MTDIAPVRTPPRRTRRALPITLAILVGLTVAALGYLYVTPSPWSPSDAAPAVGFPSIAFGEPGEADGVLPHGTTVSDDDLPGISTLDPDLLDALRRATTDAADRGTEIQVSSGWRSAAYQEHLLEQALTKYGSEEEAARWVATPEGSSHVSGEAVDIAPYDAIDWLVRNGAAYGLCQTYGNESWHYELRPEAAVSGCPPTIPDASHDARQ